MDWLIWFGSVIVFSDVQSALLLTSSGCKSFELESNSVMSFNLMLISWKWCTTMQSIVLNLKI